MNSLGCRTIVPNDAIPSLVPIKVDAESSSADDIEDEMAEIVESAPQLQEANLDKTGENDESIVAISTLSEKDNCDASSSSTTTAPDALIEIHRSQQKLEATSQCSDQSISVTLSASENDDVDVSSSSTMTASELTFSEEQLQATSQSSDQSVSPILTASENNDVKDPEVLMEIQNSRRNRVFTRRNRASSLTIPDSRENNPDSDRENLNLSSSAPQINPRKRKRPKSCSKKKSMRYVGDFVAEDMEDFEKRNKFFKLAKKTIMRQREKIKLLLQTNRRMKNKINSLKTLTSHLKEQNMISESAEFNLNATLSGPAKELFSRMLKRPGKQKYSPELRKFALTLNFYSTKSYNYVRETFLKSLPHVRTLSKWYQTVESNPGFSREALISLKIKVAEADSKGQKILCNLVFDEMAIKKRTEWDGKKFHGYVDFGPELESDQLEEAKEALVFMIVALNGCWKVPVGYFLVNGLSGTEKANLIQNCLKFVHESGVIITSVTFDGTITNFTVAKKLGVVLTPSSLKTYFLHPETNEKVYIFPDPSHMIKLVRNCFGSKQVITSGKQEANGENHIKWEYIQKLTEIQETEGLGERKDESPTCCSDPK